MYMQFFTRFQTLFSMLPKITKFATGVEIGDWRVEIKRSPILNSAEMDALTETLGLPIVPEMVFGKSHVSLTHGPSRIAIVFDAVDSLRLVSKDPCPVEVHAAKRWKERKVEESGEHTIKALQSKAAAFDWTYHTPYQGTVTKLAADQEDQGDPTPVPIQQDSSQSLDIKLLQRQDPILYSGELILFEDELADNGSSTLVVKLRYFHKYGSNTVYREHHEKEATFAQVAPCLGPDPAAVNDVNAVLPHLNLLKESKEEIPLE